MSGDMMLTNYDVAISPFGDIAIVRDDNEILQGAIFRIHVIYGELVFHRTIGNRIYGKRIKASRTNLSLVEANCKDAIMQDRRISKVNTIIATMVDTTNCNVSFVITTVTNRVITSNTTISLVE